MKKNAMLKIAAILMVAVLLTTCAISSTFAKYTTGASSSDGARVAKFGVVVTTNIDELFASSYDKTDAADAKDVVSDPTIKYDKKGDGVEVVWDLVAPGTGYTLETASKITGKPEVAVTVGYDATLTLEGWTIAENTEYCPLIFTVGTTKYSTLAIDGVTKCNDMADLKSKVEAAIETYGATRVEANTDLKTIGQGAGENKSTLVIGWEWAIGPDALDDQININDTKLGDLADKGNHSKITLNIVTTVTQID